MHRRQLITDPLEGLVETEPGLDAHDEKVQCVRGGQTDPMLTPFRQTRQRDAAAHAHQVERG